MVPGPKRNLTMAIFCTVGFIFMAVATAFNFPPILAASGAHYGKGDIVTFTFVDHRCIGGTIQYHSCGWTGTVTRPGTAPVTDVFYRDTVPENASTGLSIEALWQPRDPHSAYDIEQSDAWTTSIMSASIALIAAILFFIAGIVWWRRVFTKKDTEDKSAKKKNGKPKADQHEKEEIPA